MKPFPKQLPIAATVIISFSSASEAAFILNEGLDNTGTPSTISDVSGKAINFTMGGGTDTLLTTIELGIGTFTNSPTPLVQLWSNDTVTPATPIGTLLATFSNPATFTANAVNTFTNVGFTLVPTTTYWVVVQNTVASSSFQWLGSSDLSVTSTNGSTHGARVFGQANQTPVQWASSSGVLNQIRITAVPEPSATLLGGLGMLALLRRRRN